MIFDLIDFLYLNAPFIIVGVWLVFVVVRITTMIKGIKGKFGKKKVKKGSAKLAKKWPDQTAKKVEDLQKGMVLGMTPDGRIAAWSKEGHWLLAAPTGAGKSTGVLIPSIQNWRGSLVTIDIKGELARACVPVLNRQGIECVRIDPFGVLDDLAGIRAVGINPVQQAMQSQYPQEAWKQLAHILIDPPKDGKDQHWAGSARMMMAAFIAAASISTHEDKRNLMRVLEHMNNSGKELSVLYRSLKSSDPHHDRVKLTLEPVLSTLKDSGGNELGAIMSNVRRQMEFLETQEVASTLCDNSWSPDSLMNPNKPVALFIVLPPEFLKTQGRFLRLVVGSVVQSLMAAGINRDRRLLLAIDEAAALGHLEAIEQGVGLYRGYGARFMLCFQDLSQMKSTYGDNVARTIQGNCNSAFWSTQDMETCRHLQEVLGKYIDETRHRDPSRFSFDARGASSYSEVERYVLTADEIRTLPPDVMITIPVGNEAVELRLLKPGEFDGMIDGGQNAPNPNRSGRAPTPRRGRKTPAPDVRNEPTL